MDAAPQYSRTRNYILGRIFSDTMLKPSLSTVSNGRRNQELPANTTQTNALLLVLSSTIMLGLYYLICLPGSVRQQLKETMGGGESADFETKFQLTFTLAFVPGIFLPFFAGGVVDRIGARTCLLVLSTICFLGQVLASLGVEYENWTALLIGRFVYGIGFESLFVANEAFLASIFDQQLGIALGISSAASYIGFLLSPILSPIAANECQYWQALASS
jgi:MFS family permease